jgi:hypothetical protein
MVPMAGAERPHLRLVTRQLPREEELAGVAQLLGADAVDRLSDYLAGGRVSRAQLARACERAALALSRTAAELRVERGHSK